MHPVLSALTIMATFTVMPVYAFEASGADLVGVRLNMSEAKIAAQLNRQGFPVTRTASPCSDGSSCTVTLKATTKDGELRKSSCRKARYRSALTTVFAKPHSPNQNG